MIDRVSRIRAEVFPDEVDKPYPYLSLSEEEPENLELVLIYPVSLIPLSFPQGMKVRSFFEGDGVTKDF